MVDNYVHPAAEKSYYPHLDLIKGLAILFVVLGHVLIHGVHYGHTLLMNILASFHVPIFILVSGFLAARPIKSWQKFWSSKVLQLLLPMLCVGSLFVLSSSETWQSLLYGIYHAGYWFTYALFLLFVVYGAFRYLYARFEGTPRDRLIRLGVGYSFSLLELLLALLSWGALVLVDYLLDPQGMASGLLSMPLLSWLYPYLLLGHFISRYPWLHRLYTQPYIVALVMAVAVATIALDYNGYPILRGLPRTFASVCVVYNICLYFGASEHAVVRRLKAIGRDSLGLYLWHYFFIFAFPMQDWVLYLGGGEKSFLWELIISLGASLVVVALSYACVQILKFNPVISKLFLGAK